MNKKEIVLLGIYVIVFTILVMYITIPNEYRIVTKNFSQTIIVDADKREMFELMADIENYPQVFPENYVSVSIKNVNQYSIQSREVIQERGIQIALDVQHTILPYDNHQITILSGDAKDTTITIIFEEYGSKTRLTINSEIHARGKLIPFAYLPENNLNHAINTIINKFLEQLKVQN